MDARCPRFDGGRDSSLRRAMSFDVTSVLRTAQGRLDCGEILGKGMAMLDRVRGSAWAPLAARYVEGGCRGEMPGERLDVTCSLTTLNNTEQVMRIAYDTVAARCYGKRKIRRQVE